MSTLEKTIDLLSGMPEKQVEIIYMYAQFLKSQNTTKEKTKESVDEILATLIGSVPDGGMSLDDYREERIAKKYGFVD